LENTEGAIENGQSRKSDNIGYTRRRQTKQNTTQYELDTTMCKRTQITYIRYELSYKQQGVNTFAYIIENMYFYIISSLFGKR